MIVPPRYPRLPTVGVRNRSFGFTGFPAVARRLTRVPVPRSLVAGGQVARVPARISSILGSRGCATTTTKPTAILTVEAWVEATSTRSALLVTSFTAPVALTVAARAATATTGTTLALVTTHAARGSVRTLLLDVRLGDDLGGEVKPFAQVVEALGGQGVVVPLPGELGLEVAAGGEGLAGFDDLEVMC